MRKSMLSLVVLLAALPALAASAPLTYPAAPRGNVVDTYFGTQVPDPYRWLEDIDSAPVRAWVKSEGALTRSYLDAIPQRAAIAARFRKLYNYPRQTAPFRIANRWY